LNEQISLRNYNKAKFAFTPTLSVFASHLDQQFNTRARLFDNNVNWIPSNYVGLRLSIPLPTAGSIAQSSRSRYDYLLAKNTKEQIQIQAKLNNSQLVIEYNKAVSQKESNREIYQLRKDTYEKNLQNYEAGIISIDQTIRSFNEMISSQYNLISSEKLAEMVLAKININNKIN
jgi:outer membrane protein TolC